MFEKEYKEAFDELHPSAALQQETLELMREAQNHRPAPEPPRKTWKAAYTVSLAGTAAAVLLCMVLAPYLTKKSSIYEEDEGEWDIVGEDNMSFSDDFNADQEPSSPKPGDNADKDKADASSKYDESDLKSESSTADEIEAENTASPNAPVILDTADTKTYRSIGAFITALEQMEAPGFGTAYLNSKELLLLPASLPEGARFRCLYLETATGHYSYSYLLESGCFLEIKVQANLPKTAEELATLQENLPADYTLQKSGNRRVYTFGALGEMTLSLLPIGNAAPPDEAAADELLKAFEPALYTENNPYLDLTY